MIPQRKGDPVAFAPTSSSRRDDARLGSGLRPAFAKDGSVTAANAPASTTAPRGAGDDRRARGKLGLKPLAQIKAYATTASIRRSWAWARAGVEARAREGRLEARGPRPHGDQRGVRGAGVRGQQGNGLGHEQDQRQRRRHRARPSDRRVGLPRARHAAARDAPAQREEGLASLCIGGGMGWRSRSER
jgi:acetyl-CoA C-acetyltransferase